MGGGEYAARMTDDGSWGVFRPGAGTPMFALLGEARAKEMAAAFNRSLAERGMDEHGLPRTGTDGEGAVLMDSVDGVDPVDGAER